MRRITHLGVIQEPDYLKLAHFNVEEQLAVF